MKLTKSYREILCVFTSLFISPQNLIPTHNKSDTCHHTKRILSHFIVFLIISFSPFMISLAQQSGAIKNEPNKPVDLTAIGLQIGQQVPDISISNIHNYKSTSARVSDFRGKLLILDFWATWCSPCVAMIPKMDSLQKEFGDKVQFLSVTYQKESEVLPFLEKFEKQQGRHFSLPNIIADTVLHKLFPHVYLPHYIWIDGNGIVKAITEYKDINAENISKALNAQVTLAEKKDTRIPYDSNKPLLVNGNGGDGSNLIYHSVFTGYINGLSPSYAFSSAGQPGPGKITARNLTMLQLFRLAYGGNDNYFGLNKLILETKDSSLLKSKAIGAAYLQWLSQNNAFNYELITPDFLNQQIFKIMQDELSKLFPGYTASVENRKIKCLVLKRTSKADKLKSRGGKVVNNITGLNCRMQNSYLGVLVVRLNVLFMQNSPYPIVDGTGYKGPADLDIDANLSNVRDVNRELAKYDLQLVVDDYKTDVLVVKDRAATLPEL